MKKSVLISLLLLICINIEVVISTVLNVPIDYPTIQAALNSSNYGDTVLVQPDTYTENITWPGIHGIKLLSAGNSTNTIIDGNASGRVLYFPGNNNYDSTTVVRGFKITNGHVDVSHAYGGGIALYDASPLLSNLNITANQITGTGWAYGAGVYCDNSSPIMRNVQINKNESNGDRTHGGGIYCTDGSSPLLSNVTISENQLKNSSWCYGGGMYCSNNSNPTLNKVYITSNYLSDNASWYHGGGIYCNNNSSPVLINVLIALNIMGNGGNWYDGGAIYCQDNSNISLTNVSMSENIRENGSTISGSGIYCENSTILLTNTISWNDNPGSEISLQSGTITATYSDIRGSWAGTGNINAYPLFISTTDFHLQSISQCINTGTLAGAPSEDIEGNPRPIGFYPDMGAYEYQNCNTSTATISAIACNSYTVPSGDETYTISGTYMDTVPNVLGCDSILTINLTINIVDTSVTQNLNSLIANASGATFQWLDCDNGHSVINGATDSIFIPVTSGNYAVEVTQNTCVDTSQCFSIILSGIWETRFGSDLLFYPNPTSGKAFVELGVYYDDIEIRIFNHLGQVILEDTFIKTSRLDIEIMAPPGLYFVAIKNTDGQMATLRVLKK